MDRYRKAIENKNKIIGIENKRILRKEEIEISKKLFDQAFMQLHLMQPKEKVEESKNQIIQLRKDYVKGAKFPAIIVKDFGHYLAICDGYHRVIALYIEGAKRYPALVIER